MMARKIMGITRRGKYIIFTLDHGHMLVHLRMTGRLLLQCNDDPPGAHDHVILTLDAARCLVFRDPRKFGRIWWLADPQKILGQLGAEPLASTFTARRFGTLIRRHHRRIKPLLLDQSVIAGLGNIYVDESLWEAGIHPEQISTELSDEQVKLLHRAVQQSLRKGIQNLGTTLGSGQTNFQRPSGVQGRNQQGLNVYGQQGLKCRRCAHPLVKIRVAQRGTHICPQCQQLVK
jgi:formamidopyrimidine-DNA glycosylase